MKKKVFSKLISWILSLVMVLGVFAICYVDNLKVIAASDVVERAISWAIQTANDDSHGYSQKNRWGPDYDCSSFVISAFKSAGVNTGSASYTGDMRSQFTKHDFTWIAWSNIGNVGNLRRGDVLLKEGSHTEIYLGNNQNVGAHSDRGYPQTGDQTGTEVSVSGYYYHPWDGVLRYNGYNDFPGAEDTSYAVPVWLYAKQHDNTYDSSGNIESNRWIDAGDYCLVKNVYKNGFCFVDYPGAGGERRLAYAKASLFDIPIIDDRPKGHEMSESEAAGRTIPDGDYYIESEISQDYFIDIPGDDFNTENGKNVAMWIWDSQMPHRDGYDCFRVEYLNNGFYRIRQTGTNMCLDVNGASLYMSENIQMWENNGSTAQQWSIEQTSHGYRLRARCNAYYMDIEGGTHEKNTNIRCWEGNDSKAQSFSFIPHDLNEQPVSDGVYTIKTNTDRNCFLDVGDVPGNFYAGSNIQIWRTAANDPAEKYTIKYVGDGWYKICEKTSGLLMELADPNAGFLTASRNVQVFSDNGGKHQLWKIRKNSDGTYFIINKASGYYLDLEGANTSNGTNVSQHPYNGNSNQRWVIEPYNNTYTLSFSENNITMKKGSSKTVNINFTGDNIYTLSYQIGNTDICTAKWGDVDYSKGTTSITINAVGAGTIPVTINLQDSNDKILFSKNINVTVTGDPYSLTFSEDNITMKKGSSKTVNIKFTGENIYTTSYYIDNTGICTAEWGDIDYSKGTTSITINAVGAGTMPVTISLKDSNNNILFSKNINVTVTGDPYSLTFSEDNITMKKGSSKTVNIKFTGENIYTTSYYIDNTGICTAEWGDIDYSKGTTSITINAVGAGTMPVTISLKDSNNNILFSKNINVTVTVPTYTISYNANQGYGVPASQIKTDGTDLILSSQIPTRTGYNFIGWSTSSSATTAQYSAGGKYTANSGATLYAVWSINKYTISYNMNGGSGSIASQTKTYGTDLILSSQIPTRTGYEFIGWNTDKNATTVLYQPGAKYTANGNATLYAVWKAQSYITYYTNYGNNDVFKKVINTGIILGTKPNRTGYEFVGWSTSKDATTAQYMPGSNCSNNSNINLYAIWKKIPLINTSTISTEDVKLGSYITINASASGGTGNYTYAVWYKLTTDSSWTQAQDYKTNTSITFTPKKTGKYDVSVKVKDSSGTIVKKSFTVTIKEAALANTSKISSDSVTLGTAIKVTFASTGGTGTKKYAVWYKLATDSSWTQVQDYKTYKERPSVSFTPKKTGKYDVSVKVKDGSGAVVKKSFTVTIKEAALANTSKISSDSVTLGTAIKVTFASTGGTGTKKYAVWYKLATDSSWTQVQDYKTYKERPSVSFTPKKTGKYDVSVKVKDGSGAVVKKSFTVTIKEAALANTSKVSSTTINLGDTIKITCSATGSSGFYKYAVYYKKSSADKWSTKQDYSPNSTVTLKPASRTTYNVCVKVQDDLGNISKKNFTITVK